MFVLITRQAADGVDWLFEVGRLTHCPTSVADTHIIVTVIVPRRPAL